MFMFDLIGLFLDSFSSEALINEKRKSFCIKLSVENSLRSKSLEDNLNTIQANHEKLYKYGISINMAFEFLCLPCIEYNFSNLSVEELEAKREELYQIFKRRFNSPVIDNAFAGKSLLGNEAFGLIMGGLISLALLLLAIYLPKYFAPVEVLTLKLIDPQVNPNNNFVDRDNKSFKLTAQDSQK